MAIALKDKVITVKVAEITLELDETLTAKLIAAVETMNQNVTDESKKTTEEAYIIGLIAEHFAPPKPAASNTQPADNTPSGGGSGGGTQDNKPEEKITYNTLIKMSQADKTDAALEILQTLRGEGLIPEDEYYDEWKDAITNKKGQKGKPKKLPDGVQPRLEALVKDGVPTPTEPDAE